MAFFALLWKARTIEKYKLNYEKEKINSIVMGNTKMEQTLSQRWRHYRYDTQKRISSTFKKWYPEGSGVANFFLYLKTDQTFPNFLLKSLMGFVGGIILTYICFMFFVFQLSISLIHSTIMSSIIGVLLTLGLAFSYRIRCLVFLLIPQFFSRVGRYTLTCYALVLILTGPATNTLKNSEVLSESMACSQEQIKTSVHHLNDLVKKPYNSMKESIKLMIDRFKAIAMRAQQMVLRLNRLVFSIVGLIQYSFTWLQSISNICNAKLGSPYNRCATLLQDGLADCKKTGPDIATHCNMSYLVQAVCGAMKPFSAFCLVTDFMDDAILANIRKKLKNFTAQVRALFHVEVHTHRSYSFHTNSTRSASQVAAGIVTEIRNRTGPLLTWLAWSSCVTSLFLLLIIFRAKYYQHMYETRSRFDNRYITKELQELDLKRQRQGRETVLPLNRRERAKYITTTSFRLVASEKMYLTRSAVFMLITTFKLLIHIVADYSLYWVLMTIRYHGQYQSNLMPGVPDSGAYVTGSGFVARLFRSIVETFSIPLSRPAPSLIPCLPDPYPPDFRRYTQIGVLIFLLWFFALFEPYGLRLRHLIMGQYRPERAKARANWLYNHILRTRAGFMKFARRKLHKKYKYPTESSLTFRSWLSDRIPFQCMKYMLGLGESEPHCLLCGTTSSPNDTDTQLTKCETPRCPGVYCTNCFSEIGQLCTICLMPNDYGDLSDLSLERGSSDDDESGSEFDSTLNENTRLLEIKHGDGLDKSHESTKRWDFFISSLKSRTHNNIALVEPSVEIRNMDTHSFNNGKITNSLLKEKKFQNYKLDFEANIDRYKFALDYNNNIVLEFPKLRVETIGVTRSIGTNTERRVSAMTTLKHFVKKIMHRKQSKRQVGMLKPILYNDEINDTVIGHNISKRTTKRISQSNTKYPKFYKSVQFQLDSKSIKKRKQSNNITIWKVIKNIVQVIKLFQQCSSELNYVNRNNNENTNKRGAKKPDDKTHITSKENKSNKKANDMKNESKDTAKKARDEKKKKDNCKKVRDSNKPNKTTKDKPNKKISRHRIGGLHSFFSNHWRNVKSNIGFRSNRQIDTATFKDKTNHKRRKKRKDDNVICIENKRKESKARKESKHTRNYRISAFLADHDWMKRDYKRPDRVNIGSTDSCRVTKAPSCRVVPPVFCKNKLVAMVHLDNIPVPLRGTGVTTRRRLDRKFDSRKSESQINLKKKSSHNALERFKQRVNPVVASPAPSLMNEMINLDLKQKSSVNIDSSSICITKRASFYRKFRREAMKLDDCGILDTEELFRNDGYSDFLIPLEFQPNISEPSTDKKIDKKLSISTPSGLNMVVSNDTQKSLMSCRFEKFKDTFENTIDSCKDKYEICKDKLGDCKDSCKDKLSSCKEKLGSCKDSCIEKFEDCKVKLGSFKHKMKKWTKKIRNKKSVTINVLLDHYTGVRKKTPSEKMSEVAARIKKLCSSVIDPGCNKNSCDNWKKRHDNRQERSEKDGKKQEQFRTDNNRGPSQNDWYKPRLNDNFEQRPNDNNEQRPNYNDIVETEPTCDETTCLTLKRKKQKLSDHNEQRSNNIDDIDETEPICDETTCVARKRKIQRELEEQSIASKIPIISNSSALGESKSVVTRRCKCEPYQDSQRKWTHINAPVTPNKPSLKERVKTFCSSIFGSGCNENTCNMNKERQKRLKEKKLLSEKVIEQPERKKDKEIEQPENNNEKVIERPKYKNQNEKVIEKPKYKNPNEKVIEQPEHKNKNEKMIIVIDDECVKKCSVECKKGLGYLMCKRKKLERSKYKKGDDAKLKEIQRHIEREKEIEREIELEQIRHKEREMQIQKELGYELAKHRETQEKLMCDEDMQTIRCENCVETGTTPGSDSKLRYIVCNDAVTQDSQMIIRKIGDPVVSVTGMSYDGRVEDKDTKPPARNCQMCTRCKPKADDVDSIDCSCSIDTQMGRKRKDRPTSPAEFCKLQTTATAIGSDHCGCYNGKSFNMNEPCICGTPCRCGDFIQPRRPSSPPQKTSPYFKNPAVCQRQTSTWAQEPLESPIYQKSPPRLGTCCHLCSWARLQKSGKNNPIPKCECPTQQSVKNMNQCMSPMHDSAAQLIPTPLKLKEFSTEHPSVKSESIETSLPPAEKALPPRCTKRVTGEAKTKSIYPPDYNDPSNAEWKYSTARQSPKRCINRHPTVQEPFSLHHSPQPSSPQKHSVLRRSPQRCSPRRHSPPPRSPQQHSPKRRSRRYSPRQRSPRQHSPRQRSPQQRSPQQRSPQQCSPQQCSPQQCSPQHRLAQQQLSHSPPTSQSPGSAILLITSPSLIIPSSLDKYRGDSQKKPSKTLILKKKLPQGTRTIHVTGDVEPELNLMDYVPHKSDFDNKSILADFSAEAASSKTRFRGVAVQAKLYPTVVDRSCHGTQPMNFSNLRSSDEYTALVPPAWRRAWTRSKHHADSVKVLHRRHRGGIDPKPQYTNKKDEKREKTRGDKSHRGSRYNYCWKKYGKNYGNSANGKGSSFFSCRRLSLESSLCDIGNQKDFTSDSECNFVYRSDDEEKTDTTFCSLATVHFDILPPKRRRVKVVTNNNQGTSTEKARVCDAGTLTCDWWSPLVERKGRILLEKKKGYNDIENIRGVVDIESRRTRDSAIGTDARFVKFKSGAQLIPPHASDAADLNIMTPSRYLLESQRYYNELFTYTAEPPLPELPHYQTQTPRAHEKEKGRSPLGSRRAYQRKTKRLEESYSPRKVLSSPRKRFTDSTRTSDSPRIKTSIYRKSVKRHYAKTQGSKKGQY